MTAATDLSARSSRNITPLARLDIPGGGQVVVHNKFAYLGHMSPPHGTSIYDVSDPRNPKLVAEIAPPDHYSHTHKVRVAGKLMITNIERHKRHFYRKGERLDGVTAELTAKLGRAPDDAEIAGALGVDADKLDDLRTGYSRGYNDGGFRVWDIEDPTSPRLLSYVRTGGVGVHRFDMDETYAYISSEMDGYIGNILIIYDLKDPTNPIEVSRWHLPGQHIAGGEKPTWPGQRYRLHHALRNGDTLWAACWYAGAYAVDISDIAKPRTIGSFNYHPPYPEPTHTVFRMTQPIAGREIALIIDEEHDYTPGQPHAFLWVMDAADPANMKPLSTFHVSEMDSPYSRTGGRFGAHQFQEHQVGSLVFATWFAGGLRVIDLADPTAPHEIGHFVPEPAAGHLAPQSNDVDVDERGVVYVLDRDCGFDILQFEA